MWNLHHQKKEENLNCLSYLFSKSLVLARVVSVREHVRKVLGFAVAGLLSIKDQYDTPLILWLGHACVVSDSILPAIDSIVSQSVKKLLRFPFHLFCKDLSQTPGPDKKEEPKSLRSLTKTDTTDPETIIAREGYLSSNTINIKYSNHPSEFPKPAQAKPPISRTPSQTLTSPIPSPQIP